MTTKIILSRKWNDGISNDVHFISEHKQTYTETRPDRQTHTQY